MSFTGCIFFPHHLLTRSIFLPQNKCSHLTDLHLPAPNCSYTVPTALLLCKTCSFGFDLECAGRAVPVRRMHCDGCARLLPRHSGVVTGRTLKTATCPGLALFLPPVCLEAATRPCHNPPAHCSAQPGGRQQRLSHGPDLLKRSAKISYSSFIVLSLRCKADNSHHCHVFT